MFLLSSIGGDGREGGEAKGMRWKEFKIVFGIIEKALYFVEGSETRMRPRSLIFSVFGLIKQLLLFRHFLLLLVFFFLQFNGTNNWEQNCL